jgi:hypothetical protein
VTGDETACKMGVFRHSVKSPGAQSLLTNESEKTHPKRSCWHFCCHFCWMQFRLPIGVLGKVEVVTVLQNSHTPQIPPGQTGISLRMFPKCERTLKTPYPFMPTLLYRILGISDYDAQDAHEALQS